MTLHDTWRHTYLDSRHETSIFIRTYTQNDITLYLHDDNAVIYHSVMQFDSCNIYLLFICTEFKQAVVLGILYNAATVYSFTIHI